MIWRYRAVLFFLIFSFIMVIARLFYWQVVKAEELSILGQSQYGKVITLKSTRGEIQTSDGYPVVSNRTVYLVFANPKEIEGIGKTSDLLAPVLKLDTASISSVLARDKFWVTIQSNIDTKKKEEIKKLDLPGVGFEDQSARFYPEASMAAHVLGFVGKDDLGEDKGYFGLEGFYDRLLRGKPGLGIQIHDAFGKPILAKMNESTTQKDGRTLITNIDRTIQYSVESHLKEGIEKYGASGGLAAVMDPKTGNVLAMASFPTFDPLKFYEWPAGLYKNPFITNVYEPGSTFKTLVMSAAIDADLVKPDTKCTSCDGPISIGGYEIRTWNNKYHNDIAMIDVIRHSDNTGMVYVAKKLGLDRMLSYLQKFGIGGTTGIDLQGEVAPGLRPRDEWYPIDLATAGFGQGISITPIELLNAFSAIANDGVRMEPHVVSKIQSPDGETFSVAPKVLSKPISSKTAKVMTEILVNAVNKGEAQWARVKGHRIAGKTGTAQIPIAGHYDPHKTIASFIGFAPANHPKFAMLVIIDRPTTSIYGADTAAPVFFNIARDILDYYQIPPSE